MKENMTLDDKKFFPLMGSIYIHYIIVGISVMILGQNVDNLTSLWNTDLAGYAFVISGIGIGKFIVVFVSGALSDKYGRKPFVMGGMIGFIIAFVGLLNSPNIHIALIFSIIAGIANAISDTGSMPALMESYPKAPGTATLLIKISIAAAQFVLPFIVIALAKNNLYFGIAFYIFIVILVLNLLFMVRLKFPAKVTKETMKESDESATKFHQPVKPMIEGVALALYGYTCIGGLQIMSVWGPKIGEVSAGMTASSSRMMTSLFSLGTISAVIITASLVKKLVRPAAILFYHALVATIVALVWYMIPTPAMSMVAAFVVGYCVCGGVYQLCITTMTEFFPGNGGKCTGVVTTLNSIALWSVPLVTGAMASIDMKYVILCLAGLTGISVVLGFIVMVRDRKVFGIGK